MSSIPKFVAVAALSLVWITNAEGQRVGTEIGSDSGRVTGEAEAHEHEVAARQVPASQDLRAQDRAALEVMTFNLRFASNQPPNSWGERREACFRVLRDHLPDLIATQEGLFQQLKDLDQVLTDHDRIGVGRDGGSRGEFMAVYYRRDRLEPLEYDHFWLSPNPRLIGSKSFDADLPRMLTWIRFQDRLTGKPFIFANTHLDHAHPRARTRSAALIRAWAEKISPETPLILAGDFNAAALRDPIYPALVGEGSFFDSFAAAEHPAAEHGTFHGFRGGDAGRGRIDWILARGPIRVLRSGIVMDAHEGQYPSDHYPVTAAIEVLVPPPPQNSPETPPIDTPPTQSSSESDPGRGVGGFR